MLYTKFGFVIFILIIFSTLLFSAIEPTIESIDDIVDIVTPTDFTRISELADSLDYLETNYDRLEVAKEIAQILKTYDIIIPIDSFSDYTDNNDEEPNEEFVPPSEEPTAFLFPDYNPLDFPDITKLDYILLLSKLY